MIIVEYTELSKSNIPEKKIMEKYKKMFIATIIVVFALPFFLTFGAILKNGAILFDQPGFSTRLKTYLSTNIAETKPDHEFPELQTPHFEIPAEDLYKKVLAVTEEAGWKLMNSDPTSLTIDAVASTPLLGYQDNVKIEITLISPEHSSINVKSSSRVGRADLGANAGRILYLIKLLKN